MHLITKSVSKQLLSVCDKLMVYYPLAILLSTGITYDLITSALDDLPNNINLFESSNQFSINLYPLVNMVSTY